MVNQVSSRGNAAFRVAPPLHLSLAMMQRLGAFLFLSSLLGVGCGVGDDSGDTPVCSDSFTVTGSFVPNASMPRPATLPGTEAENNVPQPFTGCWPVGTWNFTVALNSSADTLQDLNGDGAADQCGKVSGTQAATVDASYSFVVDRMTDPVKDYVDSYSLAGATQSGNDLIWNDKIVYRLGVSEGGSGECEGGIEIFSKDAKRFWNLHPTLTGNKIEGTGDFFQYQSSQLKDGDGFKF